MDTVDKKRLDYIIKQSFKLADCDDDGFITKQDFQQFLTNIAGSNHLNIPNEAECMIAFFAIDLENGNKVN